MRTTGSAEEPWTQEAVSEMLAAQATDGRLPIWISGDGATQPPIIARTVWEIYAARRDSAWLAGTYAPLMRYNAWTRKARLNPVGLYATGGGGETGMDNSPVFDADLRDYAGQRVANVHMSACYHGFLVHLSKIADALDDGHNADRLRAQADALKQAMNRYFWHEADGWFYPTLHGRDRPDRFRQVRIKCSDAFAAVWEDVADERQAARMHDVVLTEFLSEHGVSSVSRREARYDAEHYWRGPMWIAIAAVLAEGLHRRGYAETARRIHDRIAVALDAYGTTPEVINVENGLPAYAASSGNTPCARFLTFHAGMYIRLTRQLCGQHP